MTRWGQHRLSLTNSQFIILTGGPEPFFLHSSVSGIAFTALVFPLNTPWPVVFSSPPPHTVSNVMPLASFLFAKGSSKVCSAFPSFQSCYKCVLLFHGISVILKMCSVKRGETQDMDLSCCNFPLIFLFMLYAIVRVADDTQKQGDKAWC